MIGETNGSASTKLCHIRLTISNVNKMLKEEPARSSVICQMSGQNAFAREIRLRK